MKKILNIKWLCMLAIAALCFQACQKEEKQMQVVQLLSFGPTGAMHGDTLLIIGPLLNKVTDVKLTGATVQASSFVGQTEEEIRLIIPTSTQKGRIAIVSPEGEIVSKTELDLNVAPTISSITPEARPATNITIKGQHLDWITGVTFEKDKLVTSFVSQKIDELVVTVPADAQSGKIVFASGGTEPITFESASPLVVTLPVATGFAPAAVKHAANLTINGTNLDLVKKIKLPGVTNEVTSFVSQTATQIVVTVPGDAVNGKIILYPASDVPSESATEMKIAYPVISTMTPNPIDIGATLVLAGQNLDLVKSVSFQGVATPVTSFAAQSASQLRVVVPVGSINGKIILGITNTPQTVVSADPLVINGYVIPQGPAFPIYEDGITSNWNGWIGGGWGGTVKLDNANPVKRGTASAKIDYVSGAYGVPLQLGGGNISLTSYSTFRVSIFGGPGSDGKPVNIGFNEVDGKTVIVAEGKWTDFDIPLSQISSATTLTHLYLKNYAASGAFTIYIDDMGLN